MIPPSKIYKVIHCGIVVAEGNKAEMKKAVKRLRKTDTGVFISAASVPFLALAPTLNLGDKWGKLAYWS